VFCAVVHGASVRILPTSTGLQEGAANAQALDDELNEQDQVNTVPKIVNDDTLGNNDAPGTRYVYASEATTETTQPGKSLLV